MLADLCGVSAVGVGAVSAFSPGVRPPNAVCTGGLADPSDVAMGWVAEPDARGSKAWPPISLWEGSRAPNGTAGDDQVGLVGSEDH